jgi:hypothetical protein
MTECLREHEVLDAIHAGGAMPEELRRHVAACPLCADLALVSGALISQPLTERPATLPSAEFLWWKGQIHARREKLDRAERPIAMAETLGLLAPVAGGLYLAGGWPLALGALALAAPAAIWFFRQAYHSE